MERKLTLKLGDTVWIPCNVTGGVFPDERNVWIDCPDGRWQGFVELRQLRDEVTDGPTALRATVVESHRDHVRARLPGQTTSRQYVRIPADRS
jgi:hypothetical protein